MSCAIRIIRGVLIVALALCLPSIAAARCICKDMPGPGERYRGVAKKQAPDTPARNISVDKIKDWDAPEKIGYSTRRQPGREQNIYRITGWLISVRFDDECTYYLEITDKSNGKGDRLFVGLPDERIRLRNRLLKLLREHETQMNCGNRRVQLEDPVEVEIEGAAFYNGAPRTGAQKSNKAAARWELYPATDFREVSR